MYRQHLYNLNQLDYLCRTGDCEGIITEIKNNGMMYLNSDQLNSGLSVACYEGHENVVYLLLSYKSYNFNFNSGLYAACRGGHLRLAKMMISSGANDIERAFLYACQYHQLETVKYTRKLLVGHEIFVSSQFTPQGRIADEYNAVRFIIRIKQRNFSISLPFGNTNLYEKFSSFEILGLLVSLGVGYDYLDNNFREYSIDRVITKKFIKSLGGSGLVVNKDLLSVTCKWI